MGALSNYYLGHYLGFGNFRQRLWFGDDGVNYRLALELVGDPQTFSRDTRLRYFDRCGFNDAYRQVSDTLLSSSGDAFKKAVLIRYPHANSWTIAFQTGYPMQEVADKLGAPHIHVFVPTTPNPTSGFFMIVPKDSVIELSISVEEALKHIVSMGTVPPVGQEPKDH